MAKIDNVQRLKPDDFEQDQREMIEKISYIYNYFAENVTNTINGQLDYTNLERDIKQIELMVDSSGIPTISTKFAASIGVKGTVVVGFQNLDNTTSYPTSTPFIIFTPAGDGTYTINKITGLPANEKVRLLVELIYT